MSEIVFILGAGASVDAGAPVMRNFLDRARDIWADPQRLVPEEEPHFRRVFDALQALQAVHSKSSLDLVNIENVFTLLEMADLLQRMPGNVGNAGVILTSLKKVIAATLSSSIRYPIVNNGLRHAAGYAGFVEMLGRLAEMDRGRHSVSIVTFNYDLALDFALLGFGVRYGLTENEPQHGIPLLKLHGSLNWVARADNSEVVPLMPDDLLRKTQRLNWIARDWITLDFAGDLPRWAEALDIPNVSPDPVIVPPTWKKGEHHRSLARVWQRAADHLNEAQHIFVCGYSLPETDGFFKLLYALGTAGGQPLRSFEVMDPDSTVDHRFKELLGPGARDRYRFHRGYFADFPGMVMQRFGQ